MDDHDYDHDLTAGTARIIAAELTSHVPFTIAGALTGVAVAVAFLWSGISQEWAERMFEVFHPAHVLLSAVATAAMYRLHTKGKASIVKTFLVGYVGAVGIGTLSDCLMPYAGELLLGAAGEHAHIHARPHIGFIDQWWLINPLALLGVGIAIAWPRTKISHAGHVLLSTWASLFHMLMAVSGRVPVWMIAGMGAILFVAVWLPCCASDIVLPLLFARRKAGPAQG